MILESNRSLEKCRCEISDAIRSTQLYGRVGGRERKCRFCVTNRRHHGWFDTREPGRLLPIAVYCRGSIVPSGEGVTIRVKFVYGFHMMELMIYAILLFLILSYGRNSSYEEVSLGIVCLMTIGGTVFVYLISFLFSVCSLLGRDDKEQLLYFFTSNLQADIITVQAGQ